MSDTMTEEPRKSVADLLRQQAQETGTKALDAYADLQREEEEVRDRRHARHKFCEDRGIDLKKLVNRVQIANTGGAANGPEEESKEAAFIRSYGKEQKTGGFTVEELMRAAKRAGFTVESKDDRQPILRTVVELQGKKVLTTATFKRDDKVVYVLANLDN